MGRGKQYKEGVTISVSLVILAAGNALLSQSRFETQAV